MNNVVGLDVIIVGDVVAGGVTFDTVRDTVVEVSDVTIRRGGP